MAGCRRARAAWLSAAVTGVFLAGGAASGMARAEMAPAETCTVIKGTKIQGNTCKALILNGCSHEVELNVHYEVALRQTVILPVQAEGPAYEVRDAGTAKADEKGRLMPGESRWFTHTSPGKGIEVAKCKVGFDYLYQPK
jgi:hypothetical protein